MIKDGEFLSPVQNERIKKVFILYLSGVSKTQEFVDLYAIFGDDLFTFLNVFEGKTVRVPKVHVLKKIKEYSKIYSFISKGQFTEDVFEKARVKFGRKKSHLVSIVDKVCKVLNNVKI